MIEAETRHDRIATRIAASQERMSRDSEILPAMPYYEMPPDAWPPEDYRSLAAEYPWLTLAAGLGLGALAGALLPKGFGGRVGRRALGMAGLVGELIRTRETRP